MALLPTTQLRLAQTIEAIAQAERKTELARQSLASQSMFEAYTAFRRIDQQRRGELHLSDLIEFLDDNGITYTQNEIGYVFKKFDNDKDGRINYSDFSKMVLPKGDRRLKDLAQLRESYFIDVNMLLPNEVERGLAQLLQTEIQNYRQLQIPKDSLVNSLDYDSLEAFKSLDLFNLGFVSLDSLSVFLRANGVYLSLAEQEAFFRAVDTDEDGRISYTELVEAVHLMEPLPYRPSAAVELALRESRIQSALERSRAFERLYLNSYPYYIYPYYPLWYPSYYPYLTLTELRLRESSLERLRASRLAAIESDIRLSRIQAENQLRLSRLQEERKSIERIREAERQNSIERIKRIQEEAQQRQKKLEEEAEQRRQIQQQREEELRQSRERIRQAEEEARIKQLEADRQAKLIQAERESRIRQTEAERRLIESEIRLSSLERLNSLERIRRLEAIRYPYLAPYSPYYPYYPSAVYYDPIYVPRYVPIYPVSQSQVQEQQQTQSAVQGTPQKNSPKSEFQETGSKLDQSTAPQQFEQPQDKLGEEPQGVRKSLNE